MTHDLGGLGALVRASNVAATAESSTDPLTHDEKRRVQADLAAIKAVKKPKVA